jgi:glutamate-5-semialdehyde dehydrogenase
MHGTSASTDRLEHLTPGQPVPYGGNRVTRVPDDLAAAFRPGDHLVVVQETGALLHVPAAEHELVRTAVDAAVDAFTELSACDDASITQFFDGFSSRLADDATFRPILEANDADVATASAAGRSVTRLELTPSMRSSMVAGLRGWRDQPPSLDVPDAEVTHVGWSVAAHRAPLGVVGFVFEGRPNVFADAAGVVRSRNSVVFRIGSDALGTARAIVEHALEPALRDAGLPVGAVTLVASAARSAGWALFGDRRLALAVARGSGAAVSQLGAVARQAGVAVSLHGTGGAWLVAGPCADETRLAAVIEHSLDRKVCNTLNVLCVARARAGDLVPVAVAAVEAAARRLDSDARLHVEHESLAAIDPTLLDRTVTVRRADGDHVEPFVSAIHADALGTEWEWEQSPEVSLVVVDDVDHAVRLFNRYSPRFVASLVDDDPAAHDSFYASVDAPFVGDGFTRWVDGQYALGVPELGLSNWEGGRLLARGGVLSGDTVHTVRYRARFDDPGIRR